MKKFMTTAIVILSIGLAMVLTGSVLNGIAWAAGGFNGAELAKALVNIGYIATMLSGIVLTGLGVACAVRGEDKKEGKDNKDSK